MSGYGNRVRPVPAEYRAKQAEVRAWLDQAEPLQRQQAAILKDALAGVPGATDSLGEVEAALEALGPNPHPSIRA